MTNNNRKDQNNVKCVKYIKMTINSRHKNRDFIYFHE
jgi:hypothetical protein